MNRSILRPAIPNIISNITIPLLGLVDMILMGHLSSPVYIGAIALGDNILSINMILLQFFYIFSYFTDGFAYAGEALVGRYTGAGDTENQRVAVKHLFRWGAYISIPFTLLYAIFPTPFVKIIMAKKNILQSIHNQQYAHSFKINIH